MFSGNALAARQICVAGAFHISNYATIVVT
jgi:hypothetical protein